jgi:alkanesulfonate monooxygenase SsuD/methylene tetrahydromethanopterin reductase-like flavin-dependent oxidoreductase (luciferase family)
VRALNFGISFAPYAADFEQQLELTKLADELGLDFVGIQDHPYQPRFLDTWTLISWLAPQTTRVRFVPDVANLPLRGAALLAKQAASLDVLTGGRIELGIGAGWAWDHIAGMGGPRRTPRTAVDAADEAIDVIRAFWSGERGVVVDGEHYGLRGVNPGPAPAHDIEIWTGAGGPRMLEITGRKADGWIPSLGYFPPEKLPPLQRLIDDAARNAGRDPATIRRAYNIGGVIGDAVEGEGLIGSIDVWIKTLTQWSVDIGMDTYILWPGEDRSEQVRIFAEEVVPRVKESVAATSRSAS